MDDKKLYELFNSFPETDNEETDRAFREVASRLNLGHRRSHGVLWKAVASAAVISAVFACGWLFLNRDSFHETWVEERVAPGHTDRLVLSDGTQLVLNAGSRVTYPKTFKGRERVIFLDGELMADVARDSRKPFVIKAGDVSVTVHGTSFDFKCYGDSECSELLLLKGSVSMEADGRTVDMNPGDMAQYDRRTGVINMSKFNVSTFTPFSDGGAIHFYNLTMSDIAKDLERRFDTTIIIDNEELSKMRFLATFINGESLDEILESLSVENGIVITHLGDTIRLSI